MKNNSINHIKEHKLYYGIILFLITALVAYILYLTPMQSDDYSYYNMGLGLEAHTKHYNGWSGRFIADYISSLLLHLPNHFLRSLTIASVAVTMIFIISRLPALVLNQTYSIRSFLILFAIYWVMNPALGQTLFWVVGSANYLFTNFLIVIYLYAFTHYVKDLRNRVSFISLLLLSILVGFSSENTTWIIFLFSLTSSFYVSKQKGDKKIWFSFLLVATSFSLMLFSPGNAVRAGHSAFEAFYAQSFLERALNFIVYTYPTALARKAPLLITAILLFVISIKNKMPSDLKNGVLLLFGLSLLSSLSMVMAPGFSPRALSGPILFMLLGISVLFHYLFNLKKIEYYSSLFKGIVLVISLFFISSYVLISYSYQHLAKQALLREQEIASAKLAEQKKLILPNYHYPSSLRRRDAPDEYINPPAVAKYYGFSNVQIVEVGFDFSILITEHPSWITEKNPVFAEIYTKSFGLFGSQGTTFAFVSNIAWNEPHHLVHFRILLKNGEVIEMSHSLVTVTLQGKSVLGFQADVKKENIKRIDMLFLNKEYNLI